MEISGSTPSSSVTIKLDFLTPFESHNTTVFTLAPTAADLTSARGALSSKRSRSSRAVTIHPAPHLRLHFQYSFSMTIFRGGAWSRGSLPGGMTKMNPRGVGFGSFRVC